MSEIELEIGGVLKIGDAVLTIVEIEGEEVTFRIDQTESHEDMVVSLSQNAFLAEGDMRLTRTALPR